jgi:hypothetical protein
MAVGAYADMSTGIETMIGVPVIATGGGTGGIATGTENSGSLAEIVSYALSRLRQRLLSARSEGAQIMRTMLIPLGVVLAALSHTTFS